MHSKCNATGHWLSFLFCVPVYFIGVCSHLKIPELFPWYTTLQFAWKTSACLTKEYLHCYPLAQRASGVFPGYSWLRRGFVARVSNPMWRTTVWEKQVMKEGVPVTSSLPPAYRVRSSLLPGWDRLAPTLHFSLCAPLLSFCGGILLEQASQKILKRKIYCWRPR